MEKDDLITVVCPECGKRRFSFSSNAISGGHGIKFSCGECDATIEISREYNTETNNYDGDIYVQRLQWIFY